MRLMLDMGSWRIPCGRMNGLSVWKGRIFGHCRKLPLQNQLILFQWMFRLSLWNEFCRIFVDFYLIKPQFEAGRSDVGKNGIVRSKNVHVRVLRTVCMALEQQGLHIQYLCPSPIRGGSGNIEYLVQVQRGNVSPIPYAPEAVAEQAWSQK